MRRLPNRFLVFRPFLFTTSAVGIAVAGLAYSRAKETNISASNAIKKSFDRSYEMIFGKRVPEKSTNPLENIKDIIIQNWNSASKIQKVTWGIIGVNTLVFGMWQIPRLIPFMQRHFVHVCNSGKSYTLFTSTVSHENLVHFGFNMMALNSFMPVFQHISMFSVQEVLALYLSSGLISSFGSHLLNTIKRNAVGSLGASGALFGLLAGCYSVYPQMQVQLIVFPFTLEQLFPLLVLLDIAGLVFRFKTIDHAGHLTGAAVGILYMEYGQQFYLKAIQYCKDNLI
jgi:rhomboid-like protein